MPNALPFTRYRTEAGNEYELDEGRWMITRPGDPTRPASDDAAEFLGLIDRLTTDFARAIRQRDASRREPVAMFVAEATPSVVVVVREDTSQPKSVVQISVPIQYAVTLLDILDLVDGCQVHTYAKHTSLIGLAMLETLTHNAPEIADQAEKEESRVLEVASDGSLLMRPIPGAGPCSGDDEPDTTWEDALQKIHDEADSWKKRDDVRHRQERQWPDE